jgi:hypothetical protein
MTDNRKTELFNEAIKLLGRVEQLLDQCYIAHCKAVGIAA